MQKFQSLFQNVAGSSYDLRESIFSSILYSAMGIQAVYVKGLGMRFVGVG